MPDVSPTRRNGTLNTESTDKVAIQRAHRDIRVLGGRQRSKVLLPKTPPGTLKYSEIF